MSYDRELKADIQEEKQRADGYGFIRFDKKTRKTTFECWPRFAKVADGDKAQFPGWPITIAQAANDGRKVAGWLPEVTIEGVVDPVVQVIEESTGDIIYTVRVQGSLLQPRVYSKGKHTVKIGRDKPDAHTLSDLEPKSKEAAGVRPVKV